MTTQTRHRVLVTGAAGFVGSHLCDALLALGHEVVGVDAFVASYPRARKEANLAAAREHPRFRLVEMDLVDGDLDAVLDGVDVVVNEAAVAGLPRSWSDTMSYARNNIVGLQRLLDAARRADLVRFVQASTSSVYGQHAVTDETGPTRPISPYGVTKLAAEHLLTAYQDEFGLPVVVLRYFSIYGPRQRPDMAYQIFIEHLLAGAPITVYGDGRQSRSNTYVDDAVRATVAAIDHGRVGEVYNVGGGEVLTLIEAIEVISELLGVVPDIAMRPRRVGDQRHTAADTAKAHRDLGYVPRTRARDGLAAQAAWARDTLRLPRLARA